MNYAWHFWDENLLDVWVLGCDVFGSDSSYTFHVDPIFLDFAYLRPMAGFLSCFQSCREVILSKIPFCLIMMIPREKLVLQQGTPAGQKDF